MFSPYSVSCAHFPYQILPSLSQRQEHRFGRWQVIKEARNGSRIISLAREARGDEDEENGGADAVTYIVEEEEDEEEGSD